MSGLAVVRYLLAHNAGLTAAFITDADARIKAGDLPINTVLPAISVKMITAVRRDTLSMSETTTLVIERVQASLIVPLTKEMHYPGLVQGIRLMRQACPNQRGTIAGVSVDSILMSTEGPDIEGPIPESVQRSQDVIVRWIENR